MPGSRGIGRLAVVLPSPIETMKTLRPNPLAIALLCASLTLTVARTSSVAAETGARGEWFNEARFGMFIHWGVYAVPAGEYKGGTNHAEWIQLTAKIPNSEYEKFAEQFDPVEFNAKEWVRVAKDAGMKYMVITAKHHDGFCMFDSKLTDYTIVKATPYKRDPLKDLSEACREAGIKFCVYYSIPDWHHPDFPEKYGQRGGFHGAPNPDADLEKYVAYLKGQIRELLTGYGPIGIVWFDGGGAFGGSARPQMPALIHAQEIIDEIHELQPQCLVNNRLGLPGDYTTPEQRIPTNRMANATWETCMTLNRHWGYNKNDNNWKEPKVVIRNLVDIASKGGNYLLNVGPTAEGVFPPDSIRILGEVGKWTKANGEAIYGTTASPFDAAPAWGRVTQRGNKLYLHVFDRPADGKLTIPGQGRAARRAYLLTEPGTDLQPARDGDMIAMTLPDKLSDPIDTVVVLETE
jgi:alpha-L-fucosidase